MKGVNNITKWELVIEWIDDRRYLDLPEKTKDELKKFRRINNYINKLKNSIEKHEKEISVLKGEIEKRTTKIKRYKFVGNPLYEKLLELKKKNEVTVYYSEGIHKKKLKGNSWSRLPSVKNYSQTNLKYKINQSKISKTVNLKPTRIETLDELKKVCPNWYKTIGKELMNLDWKERNNWIKSKFINLFKPYIIELLDLRKKYPKNPRYQKITFESLLKQMEGRNM
jgi:hypothetical protein